MKILKRFKVIADLKNLEDFNSYLKENKNSFRELNENNNELAELIKNKFLLLESINQTDLDRNLKKDYFNEKSNFSISFWTKRGYSEEEAKQTISKAQKKNSLNSPVVKKEDRQVLIDYYIKRGYSKEEGEIQRKLYCQKHSGWSKEYYIDKGFSEEEALLNVSEFQKQNALKFSKKNKENPEEYKARTETQLEYWLKKGLSEEEAKLALKNRQQTFTIDKCIERHGKEEGTKKWKNRQEKWKNTIFEKHGCIANGMSISANKFIEDLINNIPDNLLDKCKFGKNEKFIKDFKTKKAYKYDFTFNDKIIEYNGDYWHANPEKYKDGQSISYPGNIKTVNEIWERDKVKNDLANKYNYDLLIIWESDYIKNKEKIIEDCKKFLEI